MNSEIDQEAYNPHGSYPTSDIRTLKHTLAKLIYCVFTWHDPDLFSLAIDLHMSIREGVKKNEFIWDFVPNYG